MNQNEEKKWFTFQNKKQEGPFTLSEVQSKLLLGEISPSTYVWSSEMKDWEHLSNVAAFQPPSPEPSQFEPVPEPEESKLEISTKIVHTVAKKVPPQERRTLLIFLPFLLVVGAVLLFWGKEYLKTSPVVSGTLKAASEAMQPARQKAVEALPALGAFLNPLPVLDDVTPEDYELLKRTATAPLSREGPKVAFIRSKPDAVIQFFYVAANLPDGARIELVSTGVPETLLFKDSSTSMDQVVIRNKLGRSAAILINGFSTASPGHYEVSAIEAESQPEAVAKILDSFPPVKQVLPSWVRRPLKIFVSQSHFLGGVRDPDYEAALRRYHVKIQEKAKAELNEVRQVLGILESELKIAKEKFKLLNRPERPQPVAIKAWYEFERQWQEYGIPMERLFSTWTPEVREQAIYYKSMYQQLLTCRARLEELRKAQAAYFTDSKSDLLQIAQLRQRAENAAESEIASLKLRIEAAEKAFNPASGMPGRDA